MALRVLLVGKGDIEDLYYHLRGSLSSRPCPSTLERIGIELSPLVSHCPLPPKGYERGWTLILSIPHKGQCRGLWGFPLCQQREQHGRKPCGSSSYLPPDLQDMQPGLWQCPEATRGDTAHWVSRQEFFPTISHESYVFPNPK